MPANDYFNDERIENILGKPVNDISGAEAALLLDFREQADQDVREWVEEVTAKPHYIQYVLNKTIGTRNARWRVSREKQRSLGEEEIYHELRKGEHELGRPPTSSEAKKVGVPLNFPENYSQGLRNAGMPYESISGRGEGGGPLETEEEKLMAEKFLEEGFSKGRLRMFVGRNNITTHDGIENFVEEYSSLPGFIQKEE